MPELKDLLPIVKKNIDVPGLLDDTLDQILEPALLEVVAKSETKIDDIVVGALAPLLKAELKKAGRDFWEKLLASQSQEPGELV